MERRTAPINPTVAAIMELREEVDDLRRIINKLLRILKQDAEGKL